jgi:Uma2 family endonuclease
MRSIIPFPLPPALARLFDLLEGYTEENEEGFFMAEQDRNRQHQGQPILLYIRPSSLRGPETPERKAPDWMGEVLAEGQTSERATRYAQAGVKEYWRVDPSVPRIEVLAEPQEDGGWAQRAVFEGDQPVVSETFSGLELRPADLS